MAESCELEILQLSRLIQGLDVELTVWRLDHLQLVDKISKAETLRSQLQIRLNDLTEM